MKKIIASSFALLMTLGLLLIGCGNNEPKTLAPAPEPQASSTVGQPAAAPGEDMETLRAEAKKEITKDNARSELDRLKAEIGSDQE